MFSSHGYDGATVRGIMKLAHAKLALMSYYFKSKEDLLDAVVERRTTQLAELRKVALAKTLKTPYTLIDILDACFRIYHTLYLDEDHGWRCYFRLVAQLSQMERWTPLIAKHFNEQSSWFLDEIIKLAKDADQATVVRLWISVVNVQLNLFARTSRIATFDCGGNDDPSREQVYKNLLTFTASGMAAVLGLESY